MGHTGEAWGLTNGGRIEVVQPMAEKLETRKPIGPYDRRNDDVSVGTVERIAIRECGNQFQAT